MKDTKVRLTGLYKNKDSQGQIYLSGSLGAGKLLIFPNGYKKEEKDPDYIVYLAPKEQKLALPDTEKDAPF